MRHFGTSKHGEAAARRLAIPALLAVLALPLLLAGGCRRDMRDQPRLNPLTTSTFFADGSASRPLLTNTIARGHMPVNDVFNTGWTNGVLAQDLPVAVSPALLARGQERFAIYCTPCHDAAGTGRGMIVRRGFIQPRSYHDPALRAQPNGYYFDVITRGFANMPDYAAQVSVADRWAIVAYIRALQVSQNAPAAWLAEADRAALTASTKPADAQPAAAAEAHAQHE